MTDITITQPRVPRLIRPFSARRIAALPTVAALVTALVLAPARAHPPAEPLHDVLSLAAEAEAEVPNDLMSATLAVQAEAEDAAALADEINRAMRWALDELAAHPTIETETRDYRTWPRRDTSQTRRLIGWGGSQSLVLESDDFAAMGRAIQTLQGRLQMQGTTLSAKRETRRAATDALIEEALAAFEARADLVRRGLGADGYRILEADVQTEGSVGGVPPIHMRAMAMESADAVAEPGFAAGDSRVVVRVSGRIRLSREGEGSDD